MNDSAHGQYNSSAKSTSTGGGHYLRRQEEDPGLSEYMVGLFKKDGSAGTRWVDAKDFASDIIEVGNRLEFNIKTLAEVVERQSAILDYNGLYIAYLLDQMTEEQFEEESEKYLLESCNEKPEVIARKIEVLREHTKLDLTRSDLADLFCCDESEIDSAAKWLPEIIEK